MPETAIPDSGVSGRRRLRRLRQGLPRHERAEPPVRLAVRGPLQPDVGVHQHEPVDDEAAQQQRQQRHLGVDPADRRHLRP